MKSLTTLALVYSLLIAAACAPESSPPNIIYVLADDLGYGEVGAYGQKLIETPHIDGLAKAGMRFTQHYSGAPVCAPARSVLLTGQHAGHTHIRGNDEWGERGDTWNYRAMFDDPSLEGQRPLPDSVVTLAELLQDAGYRTGMVGKWGLGAPGTEGLPNRQGFDFFYGYNCQRQAHTLYPMHLWHNEQRVLLKNKEVAPHTALAEGADPNDPDSYADFVLNDYAPALMHDQALAFMERNSSRPFFLYYASPLPHVPLQAPVKWVRHYQEKFGPEEPYAVGRYYPHRTPRAAYAAMISTLDEQVGDLVQKLKSLGIYENTLIIFTSDNGPTYAGGADTQWFDSAAPFLSERGRAKGWLYEGGIRVPMIASWPGRIPPASETGHISAFYDVMPTLCEIAGLPMPPQSDGISFLPTLLGETQTSRHDYLYWEFPAYTGQQAVRMGKWKAVRRGIKQGKMDIELYDLEEDMTEQNEVSREFPEIVRRIEEIMSREHRPAAIKRFKMAALGDVLEE